MAQGRRWFIFMVLKDKPSARLVCKKFDVMDIFQLATVCGRLFASAQFCCWHSVEGSDTSVCYKLNSFRCLYFLGSSQLLPYQCHCKALQKQHGVQNVEGAVCIPFLSFAVTSKRR